MTLLNFDKPKKVAIEHGFEDGPTGGYMPQMSDADARRWKAKQFNIGKPNARIEIRKSFDAGVTGNGPTQVHIIVALDGWDYGKKFEKRGGGTDPKRFYKLLDTSGLNVRMSMNGPLLMTFDTFNEIHDVIHEARQYLEDHKEDAE